MSLALSEAFFNAFENIISLFSSSDVFIPEIMIGIAFHLLSIKGIEN